MAVSREQMIGALGEAHDSLLIAADAAVTRGESSTDRWGVREILAHAAAWEAEGMRRIAVLAEGGADTDYSDEAVDAFNAAVAAEVAQRPLGRVRDELERTHARLITALNGLDEAAFAPGGAAHAWVRVLTDHSNEHARELRAEPPS